MNFYQKGLKMIESSSIRYYCLYERVCWMFWAIPLPLIDGDFLI